MNAKEQDSGSILGFLSKIKRGIVGSYPEATLQEAETQVSDEAPATSPHLEEEVKDNTPPSAEDFVAIPPNSTSTEEMNTAHIQEIVITSERPASPQMRRTRGYGPTMAPVSAPKAQPRWLSSEVEAVAVADSPLQAVSMPLFPPQPTETPTESEPVEVVAQPEPVVQDTVAQPEPLVEVVAAPTIGEETIQGVAAEAMQAYAPITQSVTTSLPEVRKLSATNNVAESLDALMQIDGAIAVALVDSDAGTKMGTAGGGSINLDAAAAGNSEVMRSKREVMKALNLSESIEDILISLDDQYHLIRPLTTAPQVFMYLVLNRSNANLAMARFKLANVERNLEI